MNANSCIIRGGSVVCADRVLPDHDVVIVDGRIAVGPVTPDAAVLDECAAPADRRDWWHRRLGAALEVLGG